MLSRRNWCCAAVMALTTWLPLRTFRHPRRSATTARLILRRQTPTCSSRKILLYTWINRIRISRDVLPNKNPALGNGLGQTYINPGATKLGYVQNFNFGIQYQLPQNLVLDVTYIGNKGTNLISGGLDAMNQLPVSALRFGDALLQPLSANPALAPVPYAGFTGTLAQALRRFPQYQGVGQYLSNFGISNYHSLQVTATRHFTKGLAILGAYTYSKAIADVVNQVDGGLSAQDVYNRRLERSVTEFNTPNNFKLTWIAEVPVGKGRRYSLGGVRQRHPWRVEPDGNTQLPIGVSSAGHVWVDPQRRIV